MPSSGLILLAGLCAALGHSVPEPRYIFMNKAPGVDWDQNRPESFTPEDFTAIARMIDAPPNPALRIGAAFFFSILEGDADTLAASLHALLAASASSGVPVLVTLDGQQWWSGRPDLWNWWDPARPGYDPQNAQNVEWTGWDAASAVKIGWRNWGNQIRVAPAPNIASPRFLRANTERLERLAPIIAEWYAGLPRDKKYLLGGVKVGNEAGTGYNAFYYPGGNRYLETWSDDPSHDPQTGLDLSKGISGGVAQIGYAAVKTAGLRSSGAIAREDLAEVTQRYLATMAKTIHGCGVPKSRIYTHAGGTYPPWGTHIPFDAAINRWSSPGWSFYGLDPATCTTAPKTNAAQLAQVGPFRRKGPGRRNDLGSQGSLPAEGTYSADGLDPALKRASRTRWAAAEWWWGAATADEWKDHFLRTLRFRDCRFIAVYNWDCGYEFRNEPAGQQALRALLSDWKEGAAPER